MSNWYDDARKRLEQSQQQRNNNLLRVLNDAGALEKLEYIKQNIWKCGQIDPYSGNIPADYAIGFRLHFEYEVLIFQGAPGRHDPDKLDWFYPGWKSLDRRTQNVEAIISATQRGYGSIGLFWHAGSYLDNLLPLNPEYKLAATVEELDEAIYLYCQTAHSHWEFKVQQDWINQKEEEKYRKFEV